MSFEVVIDNARIQAHCHEHVDPATAPDITSDILLTKARLVRNSNDNDAWDMDVISNTPFPLEEDPVKSPTFIYPYEYDGVSILGDYFPPTPPGYELYKLTPFVKAHSVGPRVPITEDTSGWGYYPPPTKLPILMTFANPGLTFEIPEDSDPVDRILCGVSCTLEDEQTHMALFITPGTATTKIIVSEYGWRFHFRKL